MRASDRVTGVGIRIPLCTCTLKAAPASSTSRIVGADDSVRPVPLSFRASARTGVGIRFPLPPSAREVAARSADGVSDIAQQFLSPSRLRRQPPPSGGLAARRCRADVTSYPKGICSATLHGRTPSPTGGSTHLPHRAARPQTAVYPQAFSSTVQRNKASRPLCSAPTYPFVGSRHRPTHWPVTGWCRRHPELTFSGKTKPRDFRRGVPCWRYLSSQAVSSQVLSAEASLTSVFGMGTGGPSP